MNEKAYVNSCSIYYCGSEECKSEHTFGPAVRNQYLLHYIVSGKGTFEINGKSFSLSSGDIFLIKPSLLTKYKADKDDPWSYMWVGFDGYDVPKILENCKIEDVLKVKNADEFCTKMKNMIEKIEKGSVNEYEQLSLFYGLIGLLVEEKSISSEKIDKVYFKKAVTYMINNFVHPITVNEISNHVGIERTYLYKIFMKNCGVPPKKYLLNIRIKSAMKILMQDTLTVEQIANSTGFSDSAQFCNHFKKEIGETPSAYKKRTFRFVKD